MVLQRQVTSLGLILAGIGFLLIPFGTDVAIYLAQLATGSYWSGVLLLYVVTIGMIVVGTVLMFRPRWFQNPVLILLMLGLISVAGFLTWYVFSSGLGPAI